MNPAHPSVVAREYSQRLLAVEGLSAWPVFVLALCRYLHFIREPASELFRHSFSPLRVYWRTRILPNTRVRMGSPYSFQATRRV